LASVRVGGAEVASVDGSGLAPAELKAARADVDTRIKAALTTAGFNDITTREVTFAIAFPDVAGFAAGHLAAVPWGQSMEEAGGPARFTEAAETIREALAPHTSPDGSATLPFTSTLVTATR
jgi:hypothetical protein